MELKVYNRKGVLKLTVSPSDNSTRQKRLMGDHMLSLSFTAFECVPLEVYDYVDFEGVRFWITEAYAPKQTSTVEWEYDCKFYGIESLMRQALVLKIVDGENDPIFSLTAPAREHMALIVANINRQMGTTDWKARFSRRRTSLSTTREPIATRRSRCLPKPRRRSSGRTA